MNHQPRYYQNLFEQYGFRVYYKQLMFNLPFKDAQLDYMHEKAAEVRSDYNFNVRNARNMSVADITRDFGTVYNKAWAGHEGLKTLSYEQAKKLIKSMKPAMDPDIVLIAYYGAEPVGSFPGSNR